MKKAFGAVFVVLAAGLVVLGIYTRRLWFESRGQAEELAAARNELAAAREELSGSNRRAEGALRGQEELAEELRGAIEELEKMKGEAEAAWRREKSLGTERGTGGERAGEALAEIREGAGKTEGFIDPAIEGKSVVEVLKNIYGGKMMRDTLPGSMVPLHVKVLYGEFLEGLSEEQKGETEGLLRAAVEDEMEELQAAIDAWPDMSKFEGLDGSAEARKEALLGLLSETLDAGQLAAFEKYCEDRYRRLDLVPGVQIHLSSLNITGDQYAALKEIAREEGAAAMEGLSYAERWGYLSSVSVGEYLGTERDRSERILGRLEEVLPTDKLEQYRGLADQQFEILKFYFTALGAAKLLEK